MKKMVTMMVIGIMAMSMTACGEEAKEPKVDETFAHYEVEETIVEETIVEETIVETETPWVSKEYLEELEYNSRKNVYPEGFHTVN